MKKILGLAVAAMMVMAMVGAGTWAFFSDTEQSAGNILTAGILDLTTGGTTTTFSLGPLIPGASADPEVDVTLTNSASSTIAADLSISIGAVVNNENGVGDPESDALLGNDTTSGATQGELGSLVDIAIWLDADDSGTWTTGDSYLISGGTIQAWQAAEGPAMPAAAYETIDSFSSASWTALTLGVNLTSGSSTYFKMSYDWTNGGVTDNAAQGDDATFDVTFTLTQ